MEENSEQCPEHGDRGKLADLIPCGRDGRSKKVRGELELDPESEPSSESESDPVAELSPAPTISSQERAQRWVAEGRGRGRRAGPSGGTEARQSFPG